MSRVFEFGHYPKLFTCNSTTNKICNIIIYLVISHSTDNNVIVMLLARSACYNKIKPFVSQFFEFEDT